MALGNRPGFVDATAEAAEDARVGAQVIPFPQRRATVAAAKAATDKFVDGHYANGKPRHEARLAKIPHNVAMRAGAPVRPFYLIPDPCWTGEMGRFLTAQLELSPYDDWNVVMLPVDEEAAIRAGVPPHPCGDIPAFTDAAEHFLRCAAIELEAAQIEAGQSHDVAAYIAAKTQIKEKIRNFAALFLDALDQAWREGPGEV